MEVNFADLNNYFIVATSFSRFSLSFLFFMITFTALAMLSVSLVFGGDHDVDHDLDHDIDHDVDHDTDHDADHGAGHMGFLSFRVMMMFVAGFGAGGYFGARADYGVLGSSLFGIVGGLILGGFGYACLDFLYRHQGSSTVNVRNVIGQDGIVATSIVPNGTGEITCWINGKQEFFPARSRSDETISYATPITVRDVVGAVLIVEKRTS